MNAKSKKIIEYFEREDQIRKARGNFGKKTDGGFFVPSSLVHLDIAFQILIDEGFIDTRKYISDAGCGDGRVVALTSGAYQLASLGVEYDAEIADEARAHLNTLIDLSVLHGAPPIIVTGDFTSDKTYRAAGIEFEDIGVFFNFFNSHQQIASKIVNQSPVGTKFLLYQRVQTEEEFKGLTLEKTLELVDNSQTIVSDFTDSGNAKKRHPIPDTAYLHVYRK